MKMILITCFFTFLQALDQKSVFPPRCFCRPPPVLTPPGENFIHIPVIPPGCEPKTTPPGCKTLTPSGGTPPPPPGGKNPVHMYGSVGTIRVTFLKSGQLLGCWLHLASGHTDVLNTRLRLRWMM
jgi:hypothetical protein